MYEGSILIRIFFGLTFLTMTVLIPPMRMLINLATQRLIDSDLALADLVADWMPDWAVYAKLICSFILGLAISGVIFRLMDLRRRLPHRPPGRHLMSVGIALFFAVPAILFSLRNTDVGHTAIRIAFEYGLQSVPALLFLGAGTLCMFMALEETEITSADRPPPARE